jgi:hypothetical protein
MLATRMRMASNKKIINYSCIFNNGVTNEHIDRLAETSGRTTCTLSFWIKLRTDPIGAMVFTYYNPTDADHVDVYLPNGNNTLEVNGINSAGSQVWQVISNDVFTTNNIWYHVVIRLDTTQGTAANRGRIYVNNVDETASVTGLTASLNLIIGKAGCAQRFGETEGAVEAFDGKLARIEMLDGIALTGSSFGQTKGGVWVPKVYTGSYGPGSGYGFKLEFLESANMGKDTSGNGNNFTLVNIDSTNQSNDVPAA